MPTYTFRHLKTGKESSEFMSISEMESFLKIHPELEAACGAPGIGYNFHRIKPDEGFRDRLREMQKKHPGNTINVT